jgi:two-component system alkaline phosphatase synthesis response regulator PhoP
MPSELILLADDEPSIIQLERLYLEREGYRVQATGEGADVLNAVMESQPALLILDVMLPGIDGFEICRRLRAANNPLPIIMVTARDEDIDKIVGLELGADDYLTKPFNPRELVARVKAILRRGGWQKTEGTDSIVRIGNLEIDHGSREVRLDGKLLDLRTQEFEVLMALARNKGLVLTREQLLNQAWGFDFYGQTRTVDVHIAQLRRKLVSSDIRMHCSSVYSYWWLAVGLLWYWHAARIWRVWQCHACEVLKALHMLC